MSTYKSLLHKLEKVNTSNFDAFAMQTFYYQAETNLVYKKYLESLGVVPENVRRINDIPFLPISFFKHHRVVSENWQEQQVFESSGTTGGQTSRHFIRDTQVYLEGTQRIFKNFYGALSGYHFLFLLPSYLERENSSLVSMAESFVKSSQSEHSGFYLSDYEALVDKMRWLTNKSNKKVILWGVTFALLHLVENYDVQVPNAIIIETGGMKGRRKEIIRPELHQILREGLFCEHIHSEYGMTELLSQSYCLTHNGYFLTPYRMKIILRDPNDPFDKGDHRKSGGINVIDLANLHSCSFIETQDLGRMDELEGFQILGRFDNSDVRGCNLMV